MSYFVCGGQKYTYFPSNIVNKKFCSLSANLNVFLQNMDSTYHKKVKNRLWKLLEFSQYFLIFVIILISAIDTTKIHHVLPDEESKTRFNRVIINIF